MAFYTTERDIQHLSTGDYECDFWEVFTGTEDAPKEKVGGRTPIPRLRDVWFKKAKAVEDEGFETVDEYDRYHYPELYDPPKQTNVMDTAESTPDSSVKSIVASGGDSDESNTESEETTTDNSSNDDWEDDNMTPEEEEATGGCKVCFNVLTAYAKTKKDKVKYEPGQEAEAEKKIKELDEKHQDDFRKKAEVIYKGATAKVDILDKKKRVEVKLSKPKLKLKYRQERFNSEDAEKYGENNIKTNLDKELKWWEDNDEDRDAKKEEKDDKKREKKEEEKIAKREAKAAKKKKEKEKQAQKKSELSKKRISKTMKGATMQIAATIGKEYDKKVDDYQESVNAEFREFKKEIEDDCKQWGEEKGAKDVEKYNKNMRKAAKKIYEKKKKLMTKANVKKKSLLQKAKLKLGAMLGL